MNSTMILTAISFLLGLIGTFTKTSKEGTNKKKKITIWGYVVAFLLLVSATTAILNQINTERNNRINQEKQLAESKQQRLLSLMAVISNFDIEEIPYLNLAFYDQDTENGELADSIASARYRLFPGFGVPGVNYSLEMNISDSKSDSIGGSGAEDTSADIDEIAQPDEKLTDSSTQSSVTDADDEEETSPLKLTFTKDEINNEMNYLWFLSGYKNLTEFLLDFQDGREIGQLTLKKVKGNFSDDDIKKINTYIKDSGNWVIRVFIKNKKINSNLLHIAIPVKISEPFKTEEGYQYKIISGEPQIDNYQFSPV